MELVVITPPAPIVKPADIPGGYSDDDAQVKSLIAAAQEDIDGPTGWLARSLGPQQLEVRTDAWPCGDRFKLPCGPVLEVVSVKYVDQQGVEQSWPFPTPLYFDDMPAVRGRAGDIRIRYWAGYGERDGPDAWIAKAPERARQAIILSVQHMLSLGAENLFLRSEEVEGVGTTTYTVTDQASNIIRTTTERLLQGLRVYA